MKLKLFTFSLLFISIFSFGQKVGDLPLTNLTQKQGEQFKSNMVCTDNFGSLYSAGDDGIRILKGKNWQKFYNSDKEILFLVSDYNDALTFGGKDYFGQLVEDSIGHYKYIDLSKSLEELTNFSKLNNIVTYNNGTFFHIDNRIIKINEELTDFNFTDVNFAGKFNQNIIIQRANEGLFIYAGNNFRKINNSETYANEEIRNFIDLKDGRFIVFFEKRSIMYDGDHFINWKANKTFGQAYRNAVYNQNGLFIQTSGQEIDQVSLDGEIIRTITLQSEINHLFTDQLGHLYISTIHGVSILRTNAPYVLLPIEEEKGRSVLKVDNQFYFGTNQGAYVMDWDAFINNGLNRNYRKLNDVPVNHLMNYNNNILLATDEGLYDQKRIISPETNSNQILIINELDIMLEACKSGINLYEKEYNKWVFANHIYGLEEEIKQLVKDDAGRLWAFGSKSGIVLLNLDNDLFTISPNIYQVKGLSVGKINGINLIKGQVVICTYEGVYELNTQLERFESSTVYNELLGEKNNVQMLYQDQDDDIWYVSNNEVGIIKIFDQGVQKSAEKIRIPELLNQVNLENPMIYSLGAQNYLVNGRDGFVKIDKSKIHRPEKLRISLYKVENPSLDLVKFVKNPEEINTYEFYRDHNNVSLSFNTNLTGSEEKVEYAFSFNDKEWTDWSENSESTIELQGGANSLKAKARVGMNNVSNVLVVPLIINQEWYYEDWATYLVAGIGLLLFIVFIWIRTILFKKRRRKLDELIKINKEQQKIIDELNEKNAVISAQLIAAHSESDINTQLKKLEETNDNPEVKKAIKKLSKKIKSERKQPEKMMVDPDFMAKLKIKYPTLTKKDIRLCNLLKMDLTTKDIAPILDITVRGVEISRYRLRKKLDLDNDVVLSEFLKQI